MKKFKYNLLQYVAHLTDITFLLISFYYTTLLLCYLYPEIGKAYDSHGYISFLLGEKVIMYTGLLFVVFVILYKINSTLSGGSLGARFLRLKNYRRM